MRGRDSLAHLCVHVCLLIERDFREAVPGEACKERLWKQVQKMGSRTGVGWGWMAMSECGGTGKCADEPRVQEARCCTADVLMERQLFV